MTWVKAIQLLNWGPFEGEHRIELEADTYAVVARDEADPRRSNWIGKSRLLSAIPYALYGVRPERTEDDCITLDAPAMMVRIELSTGSVIERGRKRGKATKVVASDLLNPNWQAESDGATLAAEGWVGLDRGDFFSTSFFRQKQIAKLLTMDPSERGPLFFGWIGLERADACIERARKSVEIASSRVESLTAELGRLELSIRDLTEQAGYDSYKPALEGSIAELEAAQKETERTLSSIAATEAAIAFASLNERGKAGRKQLDMLDSEEKLVQRKSVAEEARAELDKGIGAVQEDRARACSIASGTFAGSCPVTGGECPVADEIRAKVPEAEARVVELDGSLAELETKRQTEHGKAVRAAADIHERKALELTLGGMRQRARELKAAAGDAAVPEEPPDGEVLRDRLKSTAEALAGARRDLAELEKLEKKRVDAAAQLEEAKLEEATAGASALVFERARRSVAKKSLEEIELAATTLLSDAGVPLAVAIRWELEGSGLASYCDACGVGYAISKKVKQCARCGAARGPKTIDRLDIVTSEVSGAAEDLGGLSVQLAAAAWLRGRRGSAWTAGFIDEPFGALDEANRKAVSSHLAAALRGRYGFEQALVVAHQRDALAGLKRRIEVVASEGRARIEVA